MLIPQQWAVPKAKIIFYSGSGSAIGVLTTQLIKKQVRLCCCARLCVCVCPHLNLSFLSALSDFLGLPSFIPDVCVHMCVCLISFISQRRSEEPQQWLRRWCGIYLQLSHSPLNSHLYSLHLTILQGTTLQWLFVLCFCFFFQHSFIHFFFLVMNVL